MTMAKSTTRTRATPISMNVVGETVLMKPLIPATGDGLASVEDDCVVPFVDTASAADVVFMKLNADVVFMTVDTNVVGGIMLELVEVDVNAYVTWSWKLICELGETTAPFHRTYVLTCSAHDPTVLGATTVTLSVTMNCPFCGD